MKRSHKLPPDMQQTAFQKLNALAAAVTIDDLRLPPSSINDQWRLCFRWEADGAHDVEIVDYHK